MRKIPNPDLDRANLIAALHLLTAEFRRYNDAQQVIEPKRGEANFGIANYTDRIQREQTAELAEAFAPAAKGAKGRQRER